MVTNNSSGTYIVPTINNEVTMPSQPAFLAHLGTGDTNITGDGTVFTLGSGNALTEDFDQNADFNTNGTFTAPVTGKYFLETGIFTSGWDATQTSLVIAIVTSNGSYRPAQVEPTNLRDVNNYIIITGSILADMDAADTATVTIAGIGGNLVVDTGIAVRATNFSGFLAV